MKILRQDFERLIAGGAEYMFNSEVCEEDNVAHNGRRAYIWPLLAWLMKNNIEGTWEVFAKDAAEKLGKAFYHNADGATVIYPGLHHPSNYSSNAIDCGIYVDSYHDFLQSVPDAASPLKDSINEVVHTYLANKIASPTLIHNQYLWAITGLARWVEENADDAVSQNYRDLIYTRIVSWLSFNNASGYSPYSNLAHDPYNTGITTYYHSRSIAFSWYALEKLGVSSESIEAALLMATRFLAAMVRPDGTKNLFLESKRYYFNGPYEAASNSYDIYCYSKAYGCTGDERWISLASLSLRFLCDTQDTRGAIQSHGGSNYDWQCPIMRTGHMAWLTRVPDSFLELIFESKSIDTPFFDTQWHGDELILIGDKKGWVHFLPIKTPLIGYQGQRASGLLLGKPGNINNLFNILPLHYRMQCISIRRLRYISMALIKSFRHAIYHARRSLWPKRKPWQAWLIIKDEIFSYLWVAGMKLSTEFCTKITNLHIEEGKISHDLVLSNVLGKEERRIGTRVIIWYGSDIQVIDTLVSGRMLKTTIPNGWHCNNSAIQTDNVSITHTPVTLTYYGKAPVVASETYNQVVNM